VPAPAARTAPATPRTPAPKKPAAPAAPKAATPAEPSTAEATARGKANEALLEEVRQGYQADVAKRYGGLTDKERTQSDGKVQKQTVFAQPEDQMDDYRQKLDAVRALRESGELGPRGAPGYSAPGSYRRVADVGEAEPTTVMRGVVPMAKTIEPGVPEELAARGVTGPQTGRNNALDSVFKFRQAAEAAGRHYGAARDAAEKGQAELQAVFDDPYATVSGDRPSAVSKQRELLQKLVNAREELRQYGFNDEEMDKKF
jgi:hypothetical protein